MTEINDIECPSCHAGLTARADVDYFLTECPCCDTRFSVTRGEDGLCEVERVWEWRLPSALLAVLP